MMNLSEKMEWMRKNVAYPSSEEYEFYSSAHPAIREELAKAINLILGETLTWACEGRKTWGDIANQLWPKIKELQIRYSDYGLSDSEVYRAIALFWALNYDPCIYEFMRYPNRNGGKA